MKTRYTKTYALDYYIKETKRHWWSRWEMERMVMLPLLYYRHEGKFYPIDNVTAK